MISDSLEPAAISDDPKMPFLTEALDPAEATRSLCEPLGPGWYVTAARVVRHKPGRRCLIEYDLADGSAKFTLIGKARAKGLDTSICALQLELAAGGFDAGSPHGISVPAACGIVPRWNMWLQRKAPGVPATTLLAGSGGPAVARRLAEAVHQLHEAGVPARRAHTVADEMAILQKRLPLAAASEPAWEVRIARLLAACARLAGTIREPRTRGIHRDFYPDQALVDGDRLWLLDFDLYCAGDPALDIGNCLAHLAEQALRTTGDPRALAGCEEALEARWLELAGEEHRGAVRSWTALSLARHIHISTQFAERRAFTGRLIALCEERLAAYFP